MREGQEREVAPAVLTEVEQLRGDLELDYQNRLQNELGGMKQFHVEELEKYTKSLERMAGQLANLETLLQIS
jgi:hypothetical protein